MWPGMRGNMHEGPARDHEPHQGYEGQDGSQGVSPEPMNLIMMDMGLLDPACLFVKPERGQRCVPTVAPHLEHLRSRRASGCLRVR